MLDSSFADPDQNICWTRNRAPLRSRSGSGSLSTCITIGICNTLLIYCNATLKAISRVPTDKELSFPKKFGKLVIFSNIFADFLCASLFPVGAGEPGADQPQRDLQHAQDRTGVPGSVSPKINVPLKRLNKF